MSASLCLQRDEWVEVRSAAEILATLDAEGRLDGMPFMPEMLRFCGKRIRVGASAHKTCDTITGQTRALRMDRAVHLADARCDGSAHGGCQAACLLFWKEAWLRRVEPAPFAPLWRRVASSGAEPARPAPPSRLREDDLNRLAVVVPGDAQRPRRYRCQATEVLAATREIPWWEPTQYLADWLSGNVTLGSLIASAFLRGLSLLVLWGPGRKPKRIVYDAIARALGHPAWPYENGRLPAGKTPGRKLDLVPGERVRVRSHDAILDTLAGRVNRGMGFAPEMVGYCDGTYTVRARIERILDEKTGEMREMKAECIALDGVVCRSNCSSGRMFCPRGVVAYWREIWLDRAERDA